MTRGRYSGDAGHLDFGSGSSFGSEPAPQKKPDELEEFLRFAAGALPLVGTGVGAAIGGGVGSAAGGVGAIPGATLGAGIGGAAGGLAGMGAGALADHQSAPREQAEQERLAREQERQARAQAALSLLR